jgi:hypothetical protein
MTFDDMRVKASFSVLAQGLVCHSICHEKFSVAECRPVL